MHFLFSSASRLALIAAAFSITITSLSVPSWALTQPGTPAQVDTDVSQLAPTVPQIPVLDAFSISSENGSVHFAYSPTPRPLILISITNPLPADVAPSVVQLRNGKPSKLFLKNLIGVLAISNEFTISASGEGAKKALKDFAKGRLKKSKSPYYVGAPGNVLMGQGFINLEYSKARNFPGITVHSPMGNIFIFAHGNGSFGVLALSQSAALVFTPSGIKMINTAADFAYLMHRAGLAALYSPYVQLGGYTLNFLGK